MGLLAGPHGLMLPQATYRHTNGVQAILQTVFHTRYFSMARIEGNEVKYYGTPHAPHDLILCGKILVMVKETEDVVEAAKEFFQYLSSNVSILENTIPWDLSDIRNNL